MVRVFTVVKEDSFPKVICIDPTPTSSSIII